MTAGSGMVATTLTVVATAALESAMVGVPIAATIATSVGIFVVDAMMDGV